MSYHVVIVRAAEKEYNALPKTLQEKWKSKILSLEEEPRPMGCQKLRGTESYRLRVGDYRMIYEISDDSNLVKILSIAHRRDVYR